MTPSLAEIDCLGTLSEIEERPTENAFSDQMSKALVAYVLYPNGPSPVRSPTRGGTTMTTGRIQSQSVDDARRASMPYPGAEGAMPQLQSARSTGTSCGRLSSMPLRGDGLDGGRSPVMTQSMDGFGSPLG